MVALYFSTGVYGTEMFLWYFTQPLVVLGLLLLALLDTLTQSQQELADRMTYAQYYLAQDAAGVHP